MYYEPYTSCDKYLSHIFVLNLWIWLFSQFWWCVETEWSCFLRCTGSCGSNDFYLWFSFLIWKKCGIPAQEVATCNRQTHDAFFCHQQRFSYCFQTITVFRQKIIKRFMTSYKESFAISFFAFVSLCLSLFISIFLKLCRCPSQLSIYYSLNKSVMVLWVIYVSKGKGLTSWQTFNNFLWWANNFSKRTFQTFSNWVTSQSWLIIIYVS